MERSWMTAPPGSIATGSVPGAITPAPGTIVPGTIALDVAAAPDLSDAQQMIALLQRQRDGYQQLVALGEQQSKLIEDGHGEQLLTLLAQRQLLIDQMTSLGEQIAAFHQQWPTVSVALGEHNSRKVRDLVAEVEALLATILQRDDKDRAQLELAHHQKGQELSKTASAPQALRAYKSAATGSPRFTDRQG